MKVNVEIRYGLADEKVAGAGMMTDEHAASSYGLPVFVSDRNGRMYGPGDEPMPKCVVMPLLGWDVGTPEGLADCVRERREVAAWLRAGGWCLVEGAAL